MDMETDMDMEKERTKIKTVVRTRTGVGTSYMALDVEKVFIQIKEIGTNSGSEEPECCFYQ
jgi:hypothetical protein